jgi:predicted dehydrogenase
MGSIAKKHINAIIYFIPNAMIFALRSSASLNDQYKNVHNIYNIEEIKVDLNFIIISNPTALHEVAIANCLNLKVPLFIEKPVLSNLNNALYLQNKIKNNNIFTYVACNMRFNPAIEYLKYNLLNKIEKINEINIYCGSFLPNWRPQSNFKNSYSSNKILGGGIDLDMIHEVDYAVWLFGYPEKHVSFKSSKSSLKIDSNDFAHYVLFYNDFVANITLNYYRLDTKREIEILTNNDTYIIDLQNANIFSQSKKSYIYNCKYNILDTYKKQMVYFLNHMKLGKKPMSDFDEGINILKIAIDEKIT